MCVFRFKIKTVELNKKILEGPEELRKPAAKEPTVPEGFELEIEKRLQERQLNKKSQDREKPHSFKANPLPKKVLDGIVVSLSRGFIWNNLIWRTSNYYKRL